MNSKLNKVMEIVLIEDLLEMSYEVNSWDGSLEFFNFYSMSEIDDYLDSFSPSTIIQMACFGDFHPRDDYFIFNHYGNLTSYSTWEMENELTSNSELIISRFIELYEDGHVSTDNIKITSILEAENVEV